MKLDEILKKHFCGWKDSYHLEEDKEGTKLIIAHAHKKILAWKKSRQETQRKENDN